MKKNADQILTQAATLMRSRYREQLKPHEKVEIQSTYPPAGLRIVLGLGDQKTGWLVELIADVPEVTESDHDAIYLALDFLDGVLSEHLASGRQALPRLEPVSHTFENQIIYLSGNRRRPDLEAQADALLNAAEKQ